MLRLIYSIENIIKQKKNMGCTDSQISSIDNKQQQKPKAKAIRFAPGIEDDTQARPEKDSPKIKKSKSKSKSKSKGKQNQADFQGTQKQQKQNTVKVKKARNLRHHPEHEKFIEDIMSQSRAKVASEYPQIPKSSSGFIKPVVEYAPANKGQILPNQAKLKEQNRWNVPISQGQRHHDQHLQFNQSYVSINQNVKSPYRQKEIEKRLNGIRNGRFQQSHHRAAPFEEMQCTYLQ